MPATYEKIATTTLGSATSSISFSSISSAYTDLRIILNVQNDGAAGNDVWLRFNSDTGTNYSSTLLFGDGSSATSFRRTSDTRILAYNFQGGATTSNTWGMAMIDVFSYAGSTNKTVLSAVALDYNGGGNSGRSVGLWRSTSAITALSLTSSSANFNTGTTATLYGILKA